MINFDFCIRFPKVQWKTLWKKSGKTPFPNKYWEFNIYRSSDIIVFEIVLKYKTDHAGFKTEFGILGYTIEFEFYDNRHWDDKNNCWEEEL